MFIESLLFSRFNYQSLSLNDTSVDLSMKYGLTISKQAIDNRFNNSSVNMSKALLSKLLMQLGQAQGEQLQSIFSSFNRLRIKDSTSFQLPEIMAETFPGNGGHSSEAVARIQYEFDLKNGEILEFGIHPITNNDYTNAWETRESIAAGDLIIRDLGYSSLKMLQEIDRRKAYYLNRVKTDMGIYNKVGNKYEPINLKQVEAQMRNKQLQAIEMKVFIGHRKYIPVRLVLLAVPDKMVQQRLTKQKRKSVRRMSHNNPKHAVRCSLNIFVTNTNEKQLPLSSTYNLYKLRWQIELIFKAWKSIGQIHLIKKTKPERIMTLLYLKLVWIILNMKIILAITADVFNNREKKVSVYKSFKMIMTAADLLRQALHHKKSLDNLMFQLIITINTKALSEKRKGKIFSLDVILSFAA